MSSDPNGSAKAKQVDNRGDVGVAWLPDGRLVAMEYDGHISVMNADGSNRSILFQQHLPLSGLSVCPRWRQRAVFHAEQRQQGD